MSPTEAVHASWNAATLAERIAYARRSEGLVPTDARRALKPWASAFAFGSHDALLRRLSWDGLEPTVAIAAMADGAPVDFPPAPWVERLAELAAEARRAAQAIGAPDWLRDLSGAGAGLPFAEAWLPVLRAARARLAAAAPEWRRWLSEDAMGALEAHLVRELARLGELALLEKFHDAAPDPTVDEHRARYPSFVRDLLRSEYETFLCGLPVLGRHVVLVMDQWVHQGATLVTRLAEDQRAIESTFGLRAGAVARLIPGLSDRHDGGRRVAAVEFASGLKVAYKPREVALEQAFHDCLGWLRDAGLADAPGPLRVANRGSHGWIEWADPTPLGSHDAVRAYFRSAGTLACLAHVLGATDLHGENIVATPRGPVAVDAEMLLQPSARAAAPVGSGDGMSDEAPASCLSSGFISAVVIDRDGEAFDVGGLQPSAARALAIATRHWVDIGGDGIRFVPEHRIHPVLHNDAVLRGAGIQRPEHFAGDIADGFAKAWRFLRTHGDALIADDGPLGRFRGSVRVLFRPSDQYGVSQYRMAAPTYQRRGLDRSLAIETFYRVFAHDRERPRLWPLSHDEREALEHLDIPRMTVPADATDITASTGEVVRGHFTRSGLANMRARLARLDDDELERQLDLVRTASGAYDVEGGAAATGTREDFVAAAERIGRALLARAQAAPDAPLTWTASRRRIDLYSGASGMALFLSALAQATRSDIWLDAARRAWRAVEPDAADGIRLEPLGACSGRASVCYAMALAAPLLDDGDLVTRAKSLALSIPAEAIDNDFVLDVAGGAAGALLAFLAVDAAGPDERLIELAGRCAARLVATQLRAGADAGAWRSGADVRPQAGFAHGAAGIAHALGRWAARSGRGEAAAAVREAWTFERRFYAENDGAWPAFGRDGNRVLMAAWCHGAPGIALARVSTPAGLDGGLGDEFGAAITQTISAPPSDLDHLCCGTLGRADVVMVAGLRTGHLAWIDRGVASARAVAARILSSGRRGMRGAGFHLGAPSPGFFQGLSGIGYQLLRAASPSALPSVLAFEPGAERANDGRT